MSYIVPFASGSVNPAEKNDCAVRAASNASGLPYEFIHEVMEEFGRKMFSGCSLKTISSAYKELGFVLAGVCGTTKAANYAGYCEQEVSGKTVTRYKGITLQNFLLANPKGSFVCIIRGHVLAIVDGLLIDANPVKGKSRIAAFWKIK